MYLFAYDTKLMIEIRSIQGMLDLQIYISKMDANMSATWLILTFGKPKFIAHPYRLGNHLLDRMQVEKNLIIVLSNENFQSKPDCWVKS